MGTSKSTNSLKKTDEFQSQISINPNSTNNECQIQIANLKAFNHNYSNITASEVYGNKRGSKTSKSSHKAKLVYQHEKSIQKSDCNSKSSRSSRSNDRKSASVHELKNELAQMHSYYKKKLEAERERYEHTASALQAQIDRSDELDKFCCDLQKQLMLKDNQINELKARLSQQNDDEQCANATQIRQQDWR